VTHRLGIDKGHRQPGSPTGLCDADRVFRMLELLGGLSLVTDIGTGSPLEESLKRCLVAGRLAKIIGCPDSEVSDVVYTALLQHLGCTAYAHEVARVWGDDIGRCSSAALASWRTCGGCGYLKPQA
jgi:hypothetical protein